MKSIITIKLDVIPSSDLSERGILKISPQQSWTIDFVRNDIKKHRDERED